jgi:hypothetical protein
MKNHPCLTKYSLLVFLLSVSLFFNASANSRETSPETNKLLDMTYTFDSNTIYWPTAEPFKLKKLDWGTSEGGWWYASNNYGASEHGGRCSDTFL